MSIRETISWLETKARLLDKEHGLDKEMEAELESLREGQMNDSEFDAVVEEAIVERGQTIFEAELEHRVRRLDPDPYGYHGLSIGHRLEVMGLDI